MIDPFVATTVQRFEAVARRDCEFEEAEQELFALVDDTRRQACERQARLGPVVRLLERMAQEAEIPPAGAREEEDQAAPLRYAGRMRRAADLLRGPEKDLTPGAISDSPPRRH